MLPLLESPGHGSLLGSLQRSPGLGRMGPWLSSGCSPLESAENRGPCPETEGSSVTVLNLDCPRNCSLLWAPAAASPSSGKTLRPSLPSIPSCLHGTRPSSPPPPGPGAKHVSPERRESCSLLSPEMLPCHGCSFQMTDSTRSL